jgi:HD-GYP domain-containing protein (c-di-GMP phosphodiesterase class II)
VGKIGVSDFILHKPGPLTPEEWEEMRRHPSIGYEMLKGVRFLAGPAEIVYSHHERFDGKGYPSTLAGDEIPLGSRIFAVADTFDAMTSDRPYRRALPWEAAREEIARHSGTQFDPQVVEAFLQAYEDWVEKREKEKVAERRRAA